MAERGSRSFIGRGGRTFRYIALRLVRVGGDPVHVALGFALGVFVGVFPTFGLGIPVALFAASALRWNRVSTFLGTLVMNPLTSPLFWGLSWGIGGFLSGMSGEKARRLMADVRVDGADPLSLLRGESWDRVLRLIGEGGAIYLVGSTVVALALAAASYVVALRAVVLFRRKRRERRGRRRREDPGDA